MRAATLIAGLLLLASTAWAQDARPGLDAGRAALADAEQAVLEARAARDALAATNESLAHQIAEAKSGRDARILKGVPTGALDDLLKEAHAIAEQLEVMEAELRSAESARDGRLRGLLGAVDAAIARERAAYAQSDEGARPARFEALRGLLEERGRLMGQIAEAGGAVAPGVVEAAAPEEAANASPEELRELADEVRDQQEQLRRRKDAILGRLREMKTHRRMMRAAIDFGRDELLFQDDVRNRLRTSQDPTAVATARPGSVSGGGSATSGGGTQAPTAGRGNGGDVVADRGEADPADAPTSADADEQAAPPEAAPGAAAGGADSDGDFAGEEPQAGFDDGEGAGAAEPPPPDDAAGGPGDGAGDGFEDAIEPEPAPGPDPATAIFGGGAGDGGGVVLGGGATDLDPVLDPDALVGDLNGMSARELTEQIRAFEEEQEELDEAARSLGARRKELEARARALEEE
jgi:hypothetical protein